MLPVVGVLAAGLYAVTSEAGRRWRSRFSTWDWVGAIVLGAGAIIVFSGLVGKYSQSWSIATGHYRGRMLDYGLQAAGSLTIGLGLLARGRGARRAGAAEGRGADTRAARVHEPVCRGRGRLWDLHGGQGRVPVHGLRHDRQERNLIYLVPLVFVGTALWIDRPRLRWIPLAAAVGFVAYLIVATPYQLTTVPASDSPGVAIVQMANRNLSFAHGGIENALIIALVIAVCLLVAPRFLARQTACGERSSSRSPALLVLAWSLTGQISAANYSNNEAQALVGELPAPARLARQAHGRQADALPRPEPQLGHRPRSVADRVLEPLAQVRVVGRRLRTRPGPHADAEYDHGRASLPGRPTSTTCSPRTASCSTARSSRGQEPSGDAPLVLYQRAATDPLRVQPDRSLQRWANGLQPGTVPGGEERVQPLLDAGPAARLCRRRRVARLGLRGAGPAGGSPRDDRDARRGRRQAAPHRTRHGGPALDAADRARRAASSCLRRRRPSASRCGSRPRIRRSSSAAPTSASSAARSGTASRSGRWRRA